MSATLPPPRIVDLAAAARALDEFLRALGQDQATNPALVGTGQRVAEAFAHEFCAGHGADLEALITPHLMAAPTAEKKSSGRGSRVLLRDLPVTTMCPHHLLPSEGTADVAFEPQERIVGVGAIAALVETAARRLVLQEELGEDVLAVLVATLAPRWVVVRIRLAHACMRLRGERAHGSQVETWSSHGPVPDSVLGA
jgi:GTP cyclohydrolase IA